MLQLAGRQMAECRVFFLPHPTSFFLGKTFVVLMFACVIGSIAYAVTDSPVLAVLGSVLGAGGIYYRITLDA